MAYKEKEKIIARQKALTFAIDTLTKKRKKSSIAKRTYVRNVRRYLLKNGTHTDKKVASMLSLKEISRWEAFYDSIIREKTTSELRVAYLSGPNPENDIDVFVKNGILPENIWAFESDNKIYSTAVVSALKSRFPYVKIYKGKIETYLKILPFKFDIIYLDFCSTISGKKTLSTVRDVFLYQKLETLGILITNFAFPNKNNPSNHSHIDNLNLLAANYLYFKEFTEKHKSWGGGFIESPIYLGLNPKDFLKLVQSKKELFYSQLITRILYDLPMVLIPYQRFASHKAIVELFFKNFEKKEFDRYIKEEICDQTESALFYSLINMFDNETDFDKFLNKFKRQLSIDGNDDILMQRVNMVNYFIKEDCRKNIHSKGLERIRKNWKIYEQYQFCDLFLFQQLKDVLIGQVSSPYFYNVEYTRRWCYKAKETKMFMDLITYDECRYIFDWMPTLDMFENGIKDWNRQLALRFAMDSIAKQRRWYSSAFCSGMAVIDQSTKGFKVKELKKRQVIK